MRQKGIAIRQFIRETHIDNEHYKENTHTHTNAYT